MPTLKRSCQRCCWKFRVCCGQIDEGEDSQLDRSDSGVSTDVWPVMAHSSSGLKNWWPLLGLLSFPSLIWRLVSHTLPKKKTNKKIESWLLVYLKITQVERHHRVLWLDNDLHFGTGLLTHPHSQSGAFTQTPARKFLIWQNVHLYIRPMNACTGSSFAPIDLIHCSVKAIEGMSRKQAITHSATLAWSHPVSRGRSLINDGWNCNWIESFIQIPLVGDSSMSRWVWFCDFYCRVPVNPPPAWHPALSMPLQLCSLPSQAHSVLHFLPGVCGKGCLSEIRETVYYINL